jgi:methylmalonyl-CoA/ethylmalonyl-CoA epimerase
MVEKMPFEVGPPLLDISHVGQISLPVSDLDRSEKFYGALGLRKLWRYQDQLFFDGGSVRLLLQKVEPAAAPASQGCIYFRCADIAHAVGHLENGDLIFTQAPHRVAVLYDRDVWVAFFKDPDGHALALMQEGPRGYVLPDGSPVPVHTIEASSPLPQEGAERVLPVSVIRKP